MTNGTKAVFRDIGVAFMGAIFGVLAAALTVYPRVASIETDVKAVRVEIVQLHQDVRELRAESGRRSDLTPRGAVRNTGSLPSGPAAGE